MASSSPARVSGYMRSSSSSRMSSMEARHAASAPAGCGLIQANLGYAFIRRCSQTLPGSAIPVLDAAARHA